MPLKSSAVVKYGTCLTKYLLLVKMGHVSQNIPFGSYGTYLSKYLWLVHMRHALKIYIVGTYGTFLTKKLLLVHMGTASQTIFCWYIRDIPYKTSIVGSYGTYLSKYPWLVDMRHALKIYIVGTFLTNCLLLVHIGSASQINYCLYIWDMSLKISFDGTYGTCL